MQTSFNIEKFLSLEDYATDVRVSRRKTKNDDGIASNEFFTPYSIVKRMCDKIAPETWADPSKTFLEPCAGNFQFILFILYRRIVEYHIDWKTALQTTYGLELMADNVQEGRERVHTLLRQISPNSGSQAYEVSEADSIMDHNFVCHDFFTWDFINWREMTTDETAQQNKKKKKKNAKV